MKILLVNDTTKEIFYDIGNSLYNLLKANDQVWIEVKIGEIFPLKLKSINDSNIAKKRFQGFEYQLNIISEYSFTYLTDGETLLISNINREFIKNINYSYFFVKTSTAHLIEEKHFISGKERLLNDYAKISKSQFKWFWIDLLIYSFIDITLGLFLLVLINYMYEFKVAIIWFVIIYFAIFIYKLIVQSFEVKQNEFYKSSFLKRLHLNGSIDYYNKVLSDDYVDNVIIETK